MMRLSNICKVVRSGRTCHAAAVQCTAQQVPPHIRRPEYAAGGIRGWVARAVGALRTDFGWGVEQKTATEAQAMRHAGRLAREVLDTVGRAVWPGVTTAELNAVAHDAAIKRGVYPSPLHYRGFPASCCISVNEVVAHGIPDARQLASGDLVKIDITIFSPEGFHGDCCETFYVKGNDAEDLAVCSGVSQPDHVTGNPVLTPADSDRIPSPDLSQRSMLLAKTTYDALMAAVAVCRPGAPYSSIGGVIEDSLASTGFSSVRDFCGHGIGRDFHTCPRVWHFRHVEWPLLGEGSMLPGHTFTIEPIVVEGSAEIFEWSDGWTAATVNGLRSAQFEHTLLITPEGVEVLTARLPSSPKLFWEI